MIGDPLYDAVARRREERRPKATPERPRPEGVTIYHCQALIPLEGEDTVFTEGGAVDVTIKIGCGRIAEAKPYAPIPWCHEQPMAIAGYDWGRDAEA